MLSLEEILTIKNHSATAWRVVTPDGRFGIGDRRSHAPNRLAGRFEGPTPAFSRAIQSNALPKDPATTEPRFPRSSNSTPEGFRSVLHSTDDVAYAVMLRREQTTHRPTRRNQPDHRRRRNNHPSAIRFGYPLNIAVAPAHQAEYWPQHQDVGSTIRVRPSQRPAEPYHCQRPSRSDLHRPLRSSRCLLPAEIATAIRCLIQTSCPSLNALIQASQSPQR